MLQTKLYLALVFNREDLASHFLTEMRRTSRVYGMTTLRDRLQNDTHQALLWSLQLHRYQARGHIMSSGPMTRPWLTHDPRPTHAHDSPLTRP